MLPGTVLDVYLGTVSGAVVDAAGRTPNVTGLNLEAVGVDHDPRRGIVDFDTEGFVRIHTRRGP